MTRCRRRAAAFAERIILSRVAEVAAEADVSAKTAFNYFPKKEDLALGRHRKLADLLLTEQQRPQGEAIITAVAGTR